MPVEAIAMPMRLNVLVVAVAQNGVFVMAQRFLVVAHRLPYIFTNTPQPFLHLVPLSGVEPRAY